jgi:predicted Zn-dependent peptidase
VRPPKPWSFPTPQRHRLANGLDVIGYQLPGQHVVSVSLVLDVPLAAEPSAKEGVAAITSRTLDEGTTTHDADSFAELMESAGAGFAVDLSPAGLQLLLDVPDHRLDAALTLFAEAVRTPQLAAGDIDRQTQLRLAEIAQLKANPARAAAMVFRHLIFDADSRFARMAEGEPDTVAAIDSADAGRFHREHFGPAGAKLIVAGELPGDMPALVDRHFGSWANPGQQVVGHQQPTAGDRRAVIVHRPDAVQADVQFGGFGIDRSDPRWPDISVASYIVGGAFLSRLNAALREDLGYTYGVRLGFSPLRSGGTFAMSGAFRSEVIGDALTQARRLLSVADNPFTQDEVDDAVNFFVGTSGLRYATADAVADQAAVQALAQLPDDYLDRRLAALRQVTPESATRSYESLVDPDQMTLVVAGDADVISDPIRRAGFADLSVLTDE